LNDAIKTVNKRKFAIIKNAVIVNGVIQCPGWHCGAPFCSASESHKAEIKNKF
jgi:hypothetical protein